MDVDTAVEQMPLLPWQTWNPWILKNIMKFLNVVVMYRCHVDHEIHQGLNDRSKYRCLAIVHCSFMSIKDINSWPRYLATQSIVSIDALGWIQHNLSVLSLCERHVGISSQQLNKSISDNNHSSLLNCLKNSRKLLNQGRVQRVNNTVAIASPEHTPLNKQSTAFSISYIFRIY